MSVSVLGVYLCLFISVSVYRRRC